MALSLQSVYDQYLASHSRMLLDKEKVRTRQRNDIRELYRSIMKCNRNSPVFVQNFSDDAKSNALHLKQSAFVLNESIQPFLSAGANPADQFQSAFISNSSLADVEYTSGFLSSAPKEFLLQVHQIACGQVNTGTFLQPNGRLFSSGSYSFDISTKPTGYTFQLSIDSNESTYHVMDRIARMINRSHIGITASVISDQKHRCAMQLSSDHFGLTNKKTSLFSITDMHYQNPKNLVSTFGLDHVSRPASDASFTIDGNTYSSPTNQITLTNGFTLSLKSPSEQIAKISLKTDTDDISEKIDYFITQYNNLMDELHDFDPPTSSVRMLSKDISNITRDLQDSLDYLGITIQKDNAHLTFNQQAFLDGYRKTPDITELLHPMEQLSERLSGRLNQVMINPLKYICMAMVAYKDITKDNFASPYEAYVYSGIFFSSYI